MSPHRVCGAREWHRHSVLAASIVSVPFLISVHASGQAVSDMSGMEHEHHGGAPAAQPSSPAPPRQKPAPAMPGTAPPREAPAATEPMPGMTHQEAPGAAQGAMPEMEHDGHEMGGMHMKGQFGPYPMSREASGTAWNPDSTPQQGVMFMSGDWMLMGHANLFGVYDHQGGSRGGSKIFAPGMVMVY